MSDIETLSLALRAITATAALASLGIAVAALRTVKAGIVAMAANAAERAAEHGRRHAETMASLDVQRQALETLIDGQREQGVALREQSIALREQSNALREQSNVLHEQGNALREQGAALRELVIRTAPAPAAD